MSLETMTKLGTVTVGAGTSTRTLSFTNIPQNYTDLVVKLSSRRGTSTTYGIGFVYFNSSSMISGDTSYTDTGVAGAGANGGAPTVYNPGVTSGIPIGSLIGNSASANSFASADIYIQGYSSAEYKPVYAESMGENNATVAYLDFHGAIWKNTAPITTITIEEGNGTSYWMQYTSATLYGVKAMRQAMPQTARAIGGTITRSGGYTYHTFTSSNMFIPTGTISSAEVLIVAGGGSGGGNKAGGGGAGGLLYFPGQSFTSPVPVVVGAGGAGVTSYRGASGTNSFVGSLTAAVGGGAGGGYDGTGATAAGLTGGSGGGGAGADASGIQGAGGSGTTGQGNAGGAGAYITTNTAAGGGGGGAGGAGTAGSGSALAAVGGVGGVGSSTYSAWGLATSTGQNVSGTYYYAGGGGGGTRNGTSGWTGGYGGGGNGSDGGANTAGTANTGGGGGASGQTGATPGASGGSGIVIIRYA